ncbi:hypothetical protein AAY473_030919 [Plecturocebus cupreus]
MFPAQPAGSAHAPCGMRHPHPAWQHTPPAAHGRREAHAPLRRGPGVPPDPGVEATAPRPHPVGTEAGADSALGGPLPPLQAPSGFQSNQSELLGSPQLPRPTPPQDKEPQCGLARSPPARRRCTVVPMALPCPLDARLRAANSGGEEGADPAVKAELAPSPVPASPRRACRAAEPREPAPGTPSRWRSPETGQSGGESAAQ